MNTSILKQRPIFVLLPLSLCLTACGGGSDGGSSTNAGNTTTPSNPTTIVKNFSDTATWAVDSTKTVPTCYDFDSKAEVDCQTATWDVKFDPQNRSYKLWTNSGTSGTGKGGALGLIDWSSLKTYKNGVQDPVTGRDISQLYQTDNTAGIFVQKPWYEYDLQGNHQLYPNNRVYLITTNVSDPTIKSGVQMPIYALQITNYYNAAGKSGYPTIRYIDTATPNQVTTKTIDASSQTDWVYLNLKNGETTSSTGDWQIAFNRMNVKLNGGDSGTAKVGGYLAKTPDGYYDANNQPITAKFITDNSQATLTDLTNTAGYNVGANGATWVTDKFSSSLNPAYTGTYPTLDFGWYTYNGTTHLLSAKAETSAQGALIRSAEGNSYARMRLVDIKYANASQMPTSFVYQLDIQPK